MDVKISGMNPLYHYEKFGKKENRSTFVSDDELNQRYYDLILNSHYFDRNWYVDAYDIPDNVDPVRHYLDEGFTKGYDPSPDFTTNGYYEENIAVKLHKFNPLLHYELYGKK
jgi:hypothetical protein